MTYQNLNEMSQAAFDDLIEDYITRTATGYGEMPAEFFLDLLIERMAGKTDEVVNLLIEVVDDDLVLTPDREVSDVIVRKNEIWIGKHRFVLKWLNTDRKMPTNEV